MAPVTVAQSLLTNHLVIPAYIGGAAIGPAEGVTVAGVGWIQPRTLWSSKQSFLFVPMLIAKLHHNGE
jgi:hypothetical protein